MNTSSFKKETHKKEEWPQDQGLKVYIRHNDISGVDSALRRLRKRMDNELVMEEFYKHEFFVKKSIKLRERRKKNKHLSNYTKPKR